MTGGAGSIHGEKTLDKGMRCIKGGGDRTSRYFIMLLESNLERVNCSFLEFSMKHFQTAFDHGHLSPRIRGDCCTLLLGCTTSRGKRKL